MKMVNSGQNTLTTGNAMSRRPESRHILQVAIQVLALSLFYCLALARAQQVVSNSTAKPGSSSAPAATPAIPSALTKITGVSEESAGDGVRIIVGLESRVTYESEEAQNPNRLFFDLQNTEPGAGWNGRVLGVGLGGLHRVRIAQYRPGITRVVLDVDRQVRHSVTFLTNPPRLAIEVHPTAPEAPAKNSPAINAAPKLRSSSPSAPLQPAPSSPREKTAVVELGDITNVQHEPSGDGVRITVQVRKRVEYESGDTPNPYRIFFDLKDTQPGPAWNGRVLGVDLAGLHQIRIAEYQPGATRIVLDVDRRVRYSASFMMDPPRLIIEAHPGVPPVAGAATASLTSPLNAVPKPLSVAPAVAPQPTPTSATKIASVTVTIAPPKSADAMAVKQPNASTAGNFPDLQFSVSNGRPASAVAATGFPTLLTAAKRGVKDAQFRVANAYVNGQGVSPSYQQAATWFLAAARQGHATAQSNLGVLYANGWGVQKDDREAVRWFLTAAAHEEPAGEANLGAMYLTGRGVGQDYAEGARWLRKAADQGVAEAQYSLATLYANGRGVSQNDVEAVRLLNQASALGYARAEVALGKMFAAGRGTRQDWPVALRHFRSAADRGVPEAFYQLALLYRDGNAITKDDKQAIAWLSKSADKGFAPAQYTLGEMYRTGKLVPRDEVTAYAWFAVSASNGHGQALESLNSLAPSMTLKQIADAQQLSFKLAAQATRKNASVSSETNRGDKELVTSQTRK